MDLRKEEKKKRNLLLKVNSKKVEKITGIITIILFFTMIYLIKQVSPKIADWVLNLEKENLSIFFELMLTGLGVITVCKGLVKSATKEKRAY